MTPPAALQFQRAMPVLHITDMQRSLAFYRENLGFSTSTWGEPPTFAIVQRGAVSLALAVTAKPPVVDRSTWAAYIYVADVDAIHAELAAHGANAEQPETRPYNCRDFTIDDPDGHALGIGQVLNPDPLGPGLSDRVGRDDERDATP